VKLRVFTLPFDGAEGRFDDSSVVEFLEGRQALHVHEQFFVYDGNPTWAILVAYREHARATVTGEAGRERVDWRAQLGEAERAVFDAIRRWRNERAKREGRPPYVLLTNRQIAELARQPPVSLAALRQVDGVGDARLEAFGEELLALLASVRQAEAAADGGDGG
jgi:superfamily II DNA helicase RecQ